MHLVEYAEIVKRASESIIARRARAVTVIIAASPRGVQRNGNSTVDTPLPVASVAAPFPGAAVFHRGELTEH